MTRVMRPQDAVERALSLSKADGCLVIANESTETNLRWANNTLTTNGEMRSSQLAVISIVQGTAGVASGVTERSGITADTIESLVRSSEHAAHEAGPADDAMPLIEPSDTHPGMQGWADEPATTTVGVFSNFAPALGEAFAEANADGHLLFGFAEHVVTTTYLGSSTGLRLRHDQPVGRVDLNAKSPDFSQSAWVGAGTRDFTDLDVADLGALVRKRLGWAQRQIDLPPGRYETVMPPSAVSDLMIYLYWSMDSRSADEGRSVFSKAGGGSRIGEKLSEFPLTLRSDPAEPGLECSPFLAVPASDEIMSVFDNGMPARPVNWISDGTLNALTRTRSWAKRSGGTPTPLIENLIMEGSEAELGLEDLVASTQRGLLLTCLWYIREVDPQTLLLTGLTRDGVYLVEDGEVVGAVNNFRFNESPVDMLGRILQMGTTARTLPREWSDYFSLAAMPPLKVADFNMSTVSQAS